MHEDAAVLDLMAAPLARQLEVLGDTGLLILMSACEGRCFFCAQPAVTDPPTSLITRWERIEAWLEANRALGVEDLCLGGTEPPTHADFNRTLELARDVGFRRIQLMTGGLRLEREAVRWRAAGVTSVVVPLYPDHDAVVGVPGHRERVERGLDAAVDAGMTVFVHTLALRRTLPGLGELAERVRRWDTRLVVAPVRPKDGVFDWSAEAPTWDEVAAALPRDVAVVGFPACVAPDRPREAPLLIELYFRGQARGYHHVCGGCALRGGCPGVVRAWLDRDGASGLRP